MRIWPLISVREKPPPTCMAAACYHIAVATVTFKDTAGDTIFLDLCLADMVRYVARYKPEDEQVNDPTAAGCCLIEVELLVQIAQLAQKGLDNRVDLLAVQRTEVRRQARLQHRAQLAEAGVTKWEKFNREG